MGSSQATTTPMADEHLTAEVIAAYADGALDAGERAAADEHLAWCAECRREIASVADLLAAVPRAQRRRTWPVLGAGLAAAALAFMLVPRASVPPATRASERAPRPNASSIEIVAPAENGVAAPGSSATIVWRRAESGATYTVTVTDTTGATRWITQTTDTVVVVPDSLRLEPGGRYYVYVDALRSDGWSVKSDLRAFRTPR